MKKNYIDIDMSGFKNPHPISGDITILRNEDAVKSNLKNLLFTNFYEKPYSPKYGANIKKYLFQRINVLEKNVIESEILELIDRYEPRVTNVSVEVDPQIEAQVLELTIRYTIISISSEQILNITLERIR